MTSAPTRLRKVCLALPGAAEVAMRRGPSYRVADKIFAVERTHGGAPTVWCKVPEGSQEVLIGADPKWWSAQKLDSLSLYDVYFHFSPPTDIKTQFEKQFAGRKDVSVMSYPNLLPGFYLGDSPDLSPGTPMRQWLERTKTPFYIMTNYASGNYTDKNGPATYQALTGPLSGQFLGYIHGEAMGTGGVGAGAGARSRITFGGAGAATPAGKVPGGRSLAGTAPVIGAPTTAPPTGAPMIGAPAPALLGDSRSMAPSRTIKRIVPRLSASRIGSTPGSSRVETISFGPTTATMSWYAGSGQ